MILIQQQVIVKQKRFSDLKGNYQTPFYEHKFIYVDKNKSSNYGSFLSSINNQYTSNFWSTYQGRHLKDYMINYKKWNRENDLTNLNYETVLAYWRDYVSDIRNNLAINENITNFKSLTDLSISSLKMNESDLIKIKNQVYNYIIQQVKSISRIAELNKDYLIEIYKKINGK